MKGGEGEEKLCRPRSGGKYGAIQFAGEQAVHGGIAVTDRCSCTCTSTSTSTSTPASRETCWEGRGRPSSSTTTGGPGLQALSDGISWLTPTPGRGSGPPRRPPGLELGGLGGPGPRGGWRGLGNSETQLFTKSSLSVYLYCRLAIRARIDRRQPVLRRVSM